MTIQRDHSVTRPRSAALELDEIVDVIKAVGHPARFRTLAMLREGSLCVCQIASALGLPASTVSGYLSDLRRARLVAEDRRGKWVHYRLSGRASVTRLVRELFRLAADNPEIREDARVVSELRRIPVDDLCRAGLDLSAVGVTPVPAAGGAKGRGPRHA